MKDKKQKLVEAAKKNVVGDANIQEAKNKAGFLIIGVTLLILICIGIYWASKKPEFSSLENKDAIKFQEEYESLNCEGDEDCKYLTVEVDDENPIQYSSYDEIFEILESGTGVIYFGFKECPWCRNLVPNMLSAAKNAGIDKIYYLDNHTDRNLVTVRKDNKLEETKEGTENYHKLLEKIDSVSSMYRLYDEDGKLIENDYKRLYFPTVLCVKDGKIVGFHEATLESQTNPSVPLTKEQQKELQDKLENDMLKTIVCDGAC